MDLYLLENVESTFLKKAKNDYANYLNKIAWNSTELNSNLQNALNKINKGLDLINTENQSYPYLLDTKAEVLWKMGDINNAIKIIDKAILLDFENEYYKLQKEKFLKEFSL